MQEPVEEHPISYQKPRIIVQTTPYKEKSYYSNLKSHKVEKRILNPYDLLIQKSESPSCSLIPGEPSVKEVEIKNLPNCLNSALESVENTFQHLTVDDRLQMFLSNSRDIKNPQEVKLGAMIAMYLLIAKNKTLITSTLNSICEFCINILHNYQYHYELFLISALDLLALINNKNFLINNIDIISLFLTDDNFPNLQKASFFCLLRIGYEGIKILVDICKAYPRYQYFILNNLIKTPHIIHIVIIRNLINDILSNIKEKITKALFSLNQLYWIVSGEDKLEISIGELFNDKRIDNVLVASTLRTSGDYGKEIILNLAKNHPNFSVRAAICKVFGIKLQKLNFLKIHVNFDREDYLKSKGNFLKYHIKDEIVCTNEFNQNDVNENYLEIYSEEFLAALNRMTGLEYNHNEIIYNFEHSKIPPSFFSFNSLGLSNVKLPFIRKFIKEFTPEDSKPISLYDIDQDIIRVLNLSLKDKSSFVRLSSARSLGEIGQPEGNPSLKTLISVIETERDPNIINAILNTISKLNSENNKRDIINLFNKYSKSSNNQIQFTSLQLIPHVKNEVPDNIIDFLKQNLLTKEVNKVAYAKALLFAGEKGENVLLSLFDKEDYKLQTSIASAFAFSEPDSSNIDFIIDSLLHQQACTSALVRRTILQTLSVLAHSEKLSTLLYNKNVLDIYYKNLNDFDEQVGFISMWNLVNFGPKGELILIQGSLRDDKPKTRSFCIRGLCEIGVKNFSTVIICLFQEKDESVKECICRLILEKFDEDKVIKFYMTSKHKEALIINLQSVIPEVNLKLQKFLERVLSGLSI